MWKYIGTSIKLTLAMIIICAGFYPLLIAAIGKLSPGHGNGEKIIKDGKVVGYANIGQKFTDDKYFWGRPSAVDYNAAGSAGSNKGPSNPDYLQAVHDRIDTFMAHNPAVKKSDIPSEMVTASGSGLDPDITAAAAMVQVERIAAVRKIDPDKLRSLVNEHVEKPLAGLFGPAKIDVLKLNVALDELK